MQRSRILFLALSGAAWVFFAGCEAEDEQRRIGTAEFGPDDAVGSGGLSGASGATANDSGTSSDAGGAGSGAGPTGGAAGAAGQAGHSGDAGRGTGGVSGAAGAGAGSGSSGAGGDTALCAEACATSADCRSSHFSQEYHCNTTTQRCETFAAPCGNEAECIPGASQWFWACSSDQDCYFFDQDVCVRVAGVGRCARPSPQAGGGGCQFPVANPIELPKFDGSGSVFVCAETTQKCHSGSCIVACQNDQQCTPDKNGSVCNRETGLCVCVGDQDCHGGGVSRCNTATGRCECASDNDCEDTPNADTCIAGRCGCRTTAVCTAERIFSGTRYVCE